MAIIVVNCICCEDTGGFRFRELEIILCELIKSVGLVMYLDWSKYSCI